MDLLENKTYRLQKNVVCMFRFYVIYIYLRINSRNNRIYPCADEDEPILRVGEGSDGPI